MVQKIVTRRIVYFDPGADETGVSVHIVYERGTVYIPPRNYGSFSGYMLPPDYAEATCMRAGLHGRGKNTPQSSESRSAEITTPVLSIQNCSNRSNIVTGLVKPYEATRGQNEMLGLANAFTRGYVDSLVNLMNACFMSVSEYLQKLRATHPVFDIKEPLRAKIHH